MAILISNLPPEMYLPEEEIGDSPGLTLAA
jgi:hypothetical protein